jgi:hypothetical protein
MMCYLCNEDNFIIRSNGVRDNRKVNVMQSVNCNLVSLDSTNHISENHFWIIADYLII